MREQQLSEGAYHRQQSEAAIYAAKWTIETMQKRKDDTLAKAGNGRHCCALAEHLES